MERVIYDDLYDTSIEMGLKTVDITNIEGRKIGKGNFYADNKPHTENSISLVNPLSDKEYLLEFRFTANYKGVVATRIDGQMVIEGDSVSISKTWNESAKLPGDIALEVQNAISSLCLIQSDIIYKDLMIPPPNIPTPETIPLKNFELTTIEGKKFTKPGEKLLQIRIDHNSTVTQISELNDKEANLEFRFTANYVGVGVIKTEGKLTYECEAPLIVKQWATTNNMPEKMAFDVHTGILHYSIPEAVIIARELKLPPPIPLPTVNMQKKPASPTKGSGQEVA